jgi:cytochrome c peroxidase
MIAHVIQRTNLFWAVASLAACGGVSPDDFTDDDLRAALAASDVAPLESLGEPDPGLYALGQALFFDPEISGNRDIACSSCHSPSLATSDFISLAIGTGGVGVGPNRVLPEGRRLHPRNTSDLFNRGYAEFAELNWDGAIRPNGAGGFTDPEDWESIDFPSGFQNALAAQAVAMISDRDLMAGRRGDLDVDGNANELGGWEDDELPILWDGVVVRLQGAEWTSVIEEAGLDQDTLRITDIGNALAEFQAHAFISSGSPFDRYLAGDSAAMEDDARLGAWLFFGRAGCSGCHAGPHLTDQAYHNIGVPQVGLGQEDEEPMDYGQGRQTNVSEERFHFRTPPLRNTTLTGPWMHDGAYTTLRAAVEHHASCDTALTAYNPRQLKPELQHTFRNQPIQLQRIRSTLEDPCGVVLSERDLDALLAFLDGLTDPDAEDLGELVPDSVPSGRSPR